MSQKSYLEHCLFQVLHSDFITMKGKKQMMFSSHHIKEADNLSLKRILCTSDPASPLYSVYCNIWMSPQCDRSALRSKPGWLALPSKFSEFSAC